MGSPDTGPSLTVGADCSEIRDGNPQCRLSREASQPTRSDHDEKSWEEKQQAQSEGSHYKRAFCAEGLPLLVAISGENQVADARGGCMDIVAHSHRTLR